MNYKNLANNLLIPLLVFSTVCILVQAWDITVLQSKIKLLDLEKSKIEKDFDDFRINSNFVENPPVIPVELTGGVIQ
jgi:nitrate reductase cytochrome c-type subunit